MLGALLGTLYACGTKNGGVTACPPNQAVACPCPGTNAPGAQVCLADGSGFDACVCEASGGTDVTSGPGASGSGTTSSASTGMPASSGASNPNQGACDTGGDCPTCQDSACAVALCKNEKLACDSNTACSGLMACVKTCVAMDPTCFNSCISKFQGGSNDLIAYYSCTICSPGPCAADCKGALQCMN